LFPKALHNQQHKKKEEGEGEGEGEEHHVQIDFKVVQVQEVVV
jgi:hypothetical protein